jgi:hypothetical protein
MLDTNTLEGKELLACHTPSETWLFASLSGIPGARTPGVYRVDAGPDQDLEDFELWECRNNGNGTWTPLRRITGVNAIYS